MVKLKGLRVPLIPSTEMVLSKNGFWFVLVNVLELKINRELDVFLTTYQP